MFDPKDEEKALEKWALGELKTVGERAFEFAKFFFAISAGSFGILPFFGENVSPANLVQDIGLLSVGVAAFLAIRMAEPPDFEITDKTVLSEEHAKFSKRIRRLRYLWLLFWLVGVISLVFGLTVDIGICLKFGTK